MVRLLSFNNSCNLVFIRKVNEGIDYKENGVIIIP